jgi:hypothetical protein
VRKVTVIPLKRYPVSSNRNPDSGCCGVAGVGVNRYDALFLLDMAVSDDVGKTYSISCFGIPRRTIADCPMPTPLPPKSKGNFIRITAEENDKKHRTYRVKYRIDHVGTSPPMQP